jgi:hypothetical protein
VFRLLPFLLAAVFATGVLCRVPAQDPQPVPAASPLDAKVDKAIADYEALAGDPKKQAQRNRALLWLGEIDHERAEAYLGKELAAAGDTPFAATVLQAIGVVPRPKLQDEVWRILKRPTAPPVVRNAAATAIVKFGDRGIDKLLEFVRSGDDTIEAPVRDTALSVLVAQGGERAHRGLAPMLVTGSQDDRRKLLRQLDTVHGVGPVSLARIRLVVEGDLDIAAMAWRQLCIEGHERAKPMAIDMFERLPDNPPPSVAADLLIGLCIVRDPEFYPVILRLGASTADPVRRALRTAASHAGKDPALVQFLATKGLEDKRPPVRDAALVLLREAPKEAVAPLLAKVRADLKNPKKQALDLAVGLHELLAKDPTWRADCVALASSRDAEVRTVGLSLLLLLDSDAGIVQAQRCVDDKLWELRSVAYRYLTRFRDVGSIPLLIARAGKEEGRLAAELSQALFVHTGARCWNRKEWDAWWAERKVGFQLPHADTVKGSSGGGGGQTVSYYDIPMVSARVAFLIDHSGSMSARVGTDRKYTRLEAAKENLARVLQALPATHRCNLIAYETGVKPLWDELRLLDDDNREAILARVKQLAVAGGTNIFDALEKAFADPSVDTIYLLTDGEPSAGRLIAPDDIADEVRRWNLRRQVVIHCIGLGIDSALLKRLAAESGGSYKYVR